jgi:hypothetical protein
LNVRTGHGGSVLKGKEELGELDQFMEHHLDEKQDEVRLRFRGSVTANIGWYVVPILHDQPSYNIDIT